MAVNIEDLPPEVQERVRKQERAGQSRTERVKKAVHKVAERAKAIAKSERTKAITKRGAKIVRYLAGVKEKGERKGKERKGKVARAARPRGIHIPTGDIQISAMQSGSPMHGGKMNEETFGIVRSSNLNMGFSGIGGTKKGIGLGKWKL